MRFDWYATWVTPWPWPKVKFWPWLFKIMLYMFRCVLTRQTWWCQKYCSIISNTEVIFEKLFRLKMPFLTFRDLWRLNGDLRWNLATPQRKSVSRAIFCFFGFGVASIVPEIMAGIPDKTIIFRKFELWWPLLTSIFTWAKKWPKWLRTGSLRAVDRRIARPSSFSSFRVRRGVILAPPPTMAEGGWDRHPGAG